MIINYLCQSLLCSIVQEHSSLLICRRVRKIITVEHEVKLSSLCLMAQECT